jgi:hypothetical protein
MGADRTDMVADTAGGAEVDRCVTEAAARLFDRLPEAVSLIDTSIREQIPEILPDANDEVQITLLDDTTQGNVETILHALCHNISLEDVQVPTAAKAAPGGVSQHTDPGLKAALMGGDIWATRCF